MNLSGERIYPEKCQTAEDYVLYLKHMFAYECAKGVIQPNAKVLEVGCGAGYGTAMLADRKDLQITGLDVDASVVESANNLYQSDNCHYMAFDGSRLPFQDEEFDAVISFQVIEHVVDDESFLKEMSRVLKPGGHAIVVTPNRSYRLRKDQKPWNPFHVREYDAEAFSKLIKSKFPGCRVFGISATPAVRSIEARRVYHNKLKAPARWLASVAYRSTRSLGPGMQAVKAKYSTKDFHTSPENDQDSLDLMGVWNKPPR
jgi:SAM-dependent methyltransferase